MFKKKTIAAEPENPIRRKLEDALTQLGESETLQKKHLKIHLSENMKWTANISHAEKLLNHPQCQSPGAIKVLLEMAIDSNEEAKGNQQKTEIQIAQIQGYKTEIRDALTKMKTSIKMSDELRHRLKVIGATQTSSSKPKEMSGLEDEETIFRNLRGTLLAVDALVSLQKEEISA
jgi:predicted DNA-binding protein